MERKESVFKGYDNIFAVRLRALMEKTGTTQQVLADKTDCTRQAIAQYAGGLYAPNVDKLVSIARYFGVSVDYLLGLSDAETDDKDIQFICDYTGLSEEAVSNLHEYSNDSDIAFNSVFEDPDNRPLDFINYLLTFDIMDADVLLKVNEYKHNINFYSRLTDMKKDIIDTLIQSINSKETTNTCREIADRYFKQFTDLRETERNCRIDYIECVDAFEKILSEFVKPEKEELEAKIKQCKKDLNGIRHQVLSMGVANADNNEA